MMTWMWIQQGMTYVNIHTAAYPAGEIRGQVWPSQQVYAPYQTGSYMESCRLFNKTAGSVVIPFWQSTCTMVDATTHMPWTHLKVYSAASDCMGDATGSNANGLLALKQMTGSAIAGQSEYVFGYDYAINMAMSITGVASTLALDNLNNAANGGYNCGATSCGADFTMNQIRTITPASNGGLCGTHCAALAPMFTQVMAEGTGTPGPTNFADSMMNTMPAADMASGWFMPLVPMATMTHMSGACVDYVATWPGAIPEPVPSSAAGVSVGVATAAAIAVAALL